MQLTAADFRPFAQNAIARVKIEREANIVPIRARTERNLCHGDDQMARFLDIGGPRLCLWLRIAFASARVVNLRTDVSKLQMMDNLWSHHSFLLCNPELRARWSKESQLVGCLFVVSFFLFFL